MLLLLFAVAPCLLVCSQFVFVLSHFMHIFDSRFAVALTTPRVFSFLCLVLILILNILSTYYNYLAGGEGCSKLSISCFCFVLFCCLCFCVPCLLRKIPRQGKVCCQCNLILCPRLAALFRRTYYCVYAPLNDPQIVIRRSGRIACRNSFVTHKK